MFFFRMAENPMMVQSRYILLICSLSVLACSKATPEFDLLDESAIPQPKFSGATVKNLTISSSSATSNVSGECDPKIKSLRAMAGNLGSDFTSVSDFTSSAPTVNCGSGGTFSFTLKSLQGLGYTSFYDGQVFEVQLRGVTSAGLSRSSYIRITYSTGAGNRNIWISGGGVHGGGDSAFRASDGTFKADLFVNHLAKDPSTAAYPSNANFSLRLGAAAR